MVLRVMGFARRNVATAFVPRPSVAVIRDSLAGGTRPLVMRWIAVAEGRFEARWVEEASAGSLEPSIALPSSSSVLSAA